MAANLHQRLPHCAQLEAALEESQHIITSKQDVRHAFQEPRYGRRWRASIISRDERVFSCFCISSGRLIREASSGVILKLAHLLVEILVKRILDYPDPFALQLVLVDIDKNSRDVVQKLVNPTKMEKRLINGLYESRC